MWKYFVVNMKKTLLEKMSYKDFMKTENSDKLNCYSGYKIAMKIKPNSK